MDRSQYQQKPAHLALKGLCKNMYTKAAGPSIEVVWGKMGRYHRVKWADIIGIHDSSLTCMSLFILMFANRVPEAERLFYFFHFIMCWSCFLSQVKCESPICSRIHLHLFGNVNLLLQTRMPQAPLFTFHDPNHYNSL